MHSRVAVFDECMNLPHSALKSRDKAHLRVLQGRCAGYAVALGVVEATIGRRKVPPLWLQVEAEGSMPSRGSMAILKHHVQPADVGMPGRHVPPRFTVGKVTQWFHIQSWVRKKGSHAPARVRRVSATGP